LRRPQSSLPSPIGRVLVNIVVAIPRVALAKTFGNQSLDRHPEQLLTGVTEQAPGKLVDDDDMA